MEDEQMAKQTNTPVNPRDDSAITWRGRFSLAQRESMIQETAYYRYVQRGYIPGHDIDDWLAAEAELDHGMAEPLQGESEELPTDIEVQQSSTHGPREDEGLKRMVKQHPQKAIPQIEGIEPEQAPFKE